MQSLTVWLATYDGIWFHFINGNLQNRVFDLIMPWITDLGSWGAVWLFVMFFLALSGRGEYRKMAFLGTVALVLSWLLSDEVLKFLFARPRPFIHFTDVRLLVAGPHQYSFPSGHTATAFAAATVLWRKNIKIGVAALALALLIGFSRVYVGVHYPLDVLGGIILGCGVGWVVVSSEPVLDKTVVLTKKALKLAKRENHKLR